MLDGWMVQDDSAGEEARMPGRARALVHVHMAREPLCVSRVGALCSVWGWLREIALVTPMASPMGEGGHYGTCCPLEPSLAPS